MGSKTVLLQLIKLPWRIYFCVTASLCCISLSQVAETLTEMNHTENGYDQTSEETTGVTGELVTTGSVDLPEEVNGTSCEVRYICG